MNLHKILQRAIFYPPKNEIGLEEYLFDIAPDLRKLFSHHALVKSNSQHCLVGLKVLVVLKTVSGKKSNQYICTTIHQPPNFREFNECLISMFKQLSDICSEIDPHQSRYYKLTQVEFSIERS